MERRGTTIAAWEDTMLRAWTLCAALLAAPSLANRATAAIYDVTVVGGTANTEVIGGDACGTGMTGPNACNSQTIVVEWQIFADDAPADQDPSPSKGTYASGSPFWLAADVTINGQAFPVLSVPTLNRNQTVEIWDDLNVSGITDRILIGLTGNDEPGESFISANLLLPETFSGDGLDALGSPFDGAPVLPGLSTFVLENAVGTVVGQYGITSITMGVPEPLAGAQLATAIALLGLLAKGTALGSTRR